MVRFFLMLQRFWNWVDDRDIDKHAVSIAIMYGTVTIIKWSMSFAEAHADKPGSDIALIIAAVNAPYMALQAIAIKYYFDSRVSGSGPVPSSTVSNSSASN